MIVEIPCSACGALTREEKVFWRVRESSAGPAARPYCDACAIGRARSSWRQVRAEATAEVRVEVMSLASLADGV